MTSASRPPKLAPPRIPDICFIRQPDGPLHCTEHEGHENPLHFHCYSRTEWPRRPGETQ
ncbi:hypothetical protein [Streptomyces sp. NPDC006638]|uniref:hypothetical protein n=1 Tax=Streptomyces sp. NPDC006638 TaxID=3157183 RepID=UPI0033AD7BF4